VLWTAAISGLSALWLGLGAVGVGGVIAAHLHARSAGRAVWLPTARFLVESVSERKWPRRLKEFLLLLIRCACVVLLAMMFDRPSVPAEWLPAWLVPTLPEAREDVRERAGSAMVIVLDVSDSMGVLEQGRTRLERGKDAAGRLIQRAESEGRPVGIVVAGHTARPLSLRVTDQYRALREELGALEPTRERSDLDAALGVAEQLVGAGDGGGTSEIVVITDGQASAWSGGRGTASGSGNAPRIGGGSSLSIVNTAREGLAVGLRPLAVATDRQRIDAGDEIRAIGLVRNTAEQTIEGAAVWTVTRYGEEVLRTRERLSVSPGQQSEVGVVLELREPGVHAIGLSIEGFEETTTHALVVVQPEARIGVVSVDGPVRRAAMAAADPFGRGRALAIDPRSEDAPDRVRGVDVLVIVGAGLVPDRLLDAIAGRVLADGAGLLHFVDSPDAVASGRALGERLPTLYPVDLEGQYATRGDANPGYASEVPIDDPPRPLPEDSLTVGWFNLEVRRHAPGTVGDGGEVVIGLEDGQPLLVAAARTSPVVLTMLTGIDRESSDLALAPELPILIDALVRATRAGVGGSSPEVRSAVGDVGDRVRSVGVREIGPIAGPTDGPGVLVLEEEGRGVFVAAFGVNPLEFDPEVADLEAIIEARSAGRPGERVLTSDDLISGRMQDVEIWPLLLAGAVLLLCIEAMVLLVGIGRRGVAS